MGTFATLILRPLLLGSTLLLTLWPGLTRAQEACVANARVAMRDAETDFDRVVAARDYAALALGAYGDANTPGYQVTGTASSMVTGFQATTYRRGNEMVIAFAGTQPGDLRDWATDSAAQNPGLTPGQFQQANQLVQAVLKENPGANISLTGHSLGGQLALYAGGINHLDAIAFDAPAPNAAMKNEIAAAQALQKSPAKTLSLNFVGREALQSRAGNNRDIVSALFDHYATQIPVASGEKSPAASIAPYHSMKELQKGMERTVEQGREAYQNLAKIWFGVEARGKPILVPHTQIEIPHAEDLNGKKLFKNAYEQGSFQAAPALPSSP